MRARQKINFWAEPNRVCTVMKIKMARSPPYLQNYDRARIQQKAIFFLRCTLLLMNNPPFLASYYKFFLNCATVQLKARVLIKTICMAGFLKMSH